MVILASQLMTGLSAKILEDAEGNPGINRTLHDIDSIKINNKTVFHT
jgi:hypothetical protein